MLLGYARISKADGSQALAPQKDVLLAAGVGPGHLYEDRASGKRDDRPGLAACLKALRRGGVLGGWKPDPPRRGLPPLGNPGQGPAGGGAGLQGLARPGPRDGPPTPPRQPPLR